MNPENTLQFLTTIGELKRVKRTGWVNHGVKEPESVADHMYRMAIMTFLLKHNDQNIDASRCLKLAVVHDLAECIVGDIVANGPEEREEKHKKEDDAMQHLASLIDPQIGKEILELYKEYENQTTVESKAVKDLDRFEMILQAYEYEKAENRCGELQDFFNSTNGKFQNPTVVKLVEELVKKRTADKK